MDTTLKNSYMAGGIFALLGFIFLYAGLTSTPISSFTTILGVLFGGTGLASFKYPQIGEVLFHWMNKGSENKNTHYKSKTKQYQSRTSNSQQVNNSGGTVIINNNKIYRRKYRYSRRRH